MMMFPTGFPPSESSRRIEFPRRKRMWRMTTSCVLTSVVSPLMHTPSPGADCPAIVTKGWLIFTGDFRSMSPATAKTMVRGPEASAASRKLPGPASFRFLTTQTRPPRPPRVQAPSPSAPGNAEIRSCRSCTLPIWARAASSNRVEAGDVCARDDDVPNSHRARATDVASGFTVFCGQLMRARRPLVRHPQPLWHRRADFVEARTIAAVRFGESRHTGGFTVARASALQIVV